MAQELYEKCDDETEKIIKAYSMITYDHSDNSGYLDSNEIKFYKKCESVWDNYFYLLLQTSALLNDKIYNLVIDNFHKKLSQYNDIIDEIVETSKVNYAATTYEADFHHNPFTKITIYGGIDTLCFPICIERILANLIGQGYYDFIFLKKKK